MNKQGTLFVVTALTAGLLTAGCTSSTSSGGAAAQNSVVTSSTATAPGAAAAPDASAAAELRASLTALLSDHVWLAGNALQTAVLERGNLKDPAVKGAVAALDANSVALSKAIGSAYPSAEAPFLASWRQHIGFFVNYTLGKATGNAAMASKAKSDLDGYRTSFGQLIHSVVPELSADAVAKELIPHVQSLLAAIDAAVAGKPDFQAKLAASAEHMVMTADVLAGAIAKDKHLAGNVDGTAEATRAVLTAQLNAHVWLAGNALNTAVREGGNLNNPVVKGSVAALDANSVELSKTLGSVYPSAAAPFLASWRQHIGFFVNYTLGKATKNQAMAMKAEKDLDGYRISFGQLIHSVVPQLPAAAVAKELVPHVQTLLAAIDAAVAGSPDFQELLTAAAEHMTMTAAVLTHGIVANKHITD